MATTATIVLTGLVYLTSLPKGNNPTVLKGEVMRSANDRVSSRGGTIPRHRAFIRVLKSSLAVPSARKPDLDVIVGGVTAAEMLVYFLDGESITITGFTNNQLEFTNPGGSDKAKFSESVLHVQDFCPTCRAQAGSDFDSPDLRHVGANFALDKGRVFARALSKCSTGTDVVWSFDAEFGYPAYTQAKVAREVAIEYDVTSNLVLQTAPLPGSAANPLILTFKNMKLDVLIGSATIEDTMGVGLSHGADRIDHHFELFYYLLEHSNAAKHPLPVADASCPDFHRVDGVDCPPVQQ